MSVDAWNSFFAPPRVVEREIILGMLAGDEIGILARVK